MQKRGRPTKLTKNLHEEIVSYIEQGLTYKDVCFAVGIAESTFYDWKIEFAEFSEAIKKAEMKCKAERIATIFKASEKSWQAAAWWLERRYPKEYGKQMESEKEMPPVFFGFLAGSQFVQSKDAVPLQIPRKKSVVATVNDRL